MKMQIEQAKMEADQQMRGMELLAEQQRDQNRAIMDQKAFEQKAPSKQPRPKPMSR